MNDSVSYLITIYNKAECIPKLIEGLFNQEGDFEKEYIFIDDGSTDNSLAVLADLVKGRSNATIINQTNQGPSKATNHALKLAKMDWIYLVDGDDYLQSDATITLLNLYKKYPDVKVFMGKHLNDPKSKVLSGDVSHIQDALKKAVNFFSLTMSANLINKDLLLSVNGCDEDVFIQDYSIALRLARYASFVLIDKLLAYNIDCGQQRLSTNKERETYCTLSALYNFIQKNLDIKYEYKFDALKFLIRKSFKWHVKCTPSILFSKHFLRYLITRFDIGYSDDKILLWMKEAMGLYRNIDLKK